MKVVPWAVEENGGSWQEEGTAADGKRSVSSGRAKEREPQCNSWRLGRPLVLCWWMVDELAVFGCVDSLLRHRFRHTFPSRFSAGRLRQFSLEWVHFHPLVS